jgi:hypothetical protein
VEKPSRFETPRLEDIEGSFRRIVADGGRRITENQDRGDIEPGCRQAEVEIEGLEAFQAGVRHDQGRVKPGGEPQRFLAVDRVDDLVSTLVEGETEISTTLV